MTTIALRRLAVAAVLLGFAASPAAALEGPPPPPLEAALRLKGGRSLVFQPVHLRRGTTLRVSHVQFGDGSVKPGEQRAVQLVVYGSERSPLSGQFPVLYTETQPVAETGAGAGGGPHVKVFDGYTPDVNDQGIIAILIGLLLPAVQTDPVKVIPLPATHALTAEVIDPSGIGLLLPAVQKVRDAAAR